MTSGPGRSLYISSLSLLCSRPDAKTLPPRKDEAIAAVGDVVGWKGAELSFDAELTEDPPDDLQEQPTSDSVWLVKSGDGRFAGWVDLETGEVLDVLQEVSSGGRI